MTISAIVPEPKQFTRQMRLSDSPTMGPMAWVPYHMGGSPIQ